MTTAFYGADTDQLRSLADRFQAGGRRIEELRITLESAVMNPAIWTGPDADSWRERWQSQAAPRLGSVSEQVVAHHGHLDTQAEEQDTASESGEGLSLGGFLEKLAKIGAKAFSLYNTGKSILGHIDDLKRLLDARRMGPEDFTRVWDSIKLKNWMKFESEGFGKLFKTLAGQAFKDIPGLKSIPGDVWKWAGKKIDAIPTMLGEGGKIIEKIGAKLGPDGLATLGKASKMLGKAVPFLDIGVGIHQMMTADDGYGKTSGFLSVAGGVCMIAGLAFPPLLVVGAGLSAASLTMDIVDLGGELLGFDPSKSVSEAVSNGLDKAGDAISEGMDKVSEGASWAKKKLGSIFG